MHALARLRLISKRPKILLALFACALVFAAAEAGAQPAPTDKLRVICFGAHPDDCELQAGGVAALWAAQGHEVKLVSVTNGDIGHWRESGGPLALRRKKEVEAASRILGSTVAVLDIHDGELEPTLENRRKIIRLIREWKADIVLAPRPNDYHPDHRYTGVLVQDAAFMVQVPFFCPDTPPLQRNPVFMYYTDRFQKPQPSAPSIAVSIDAVIAKKLDALAVMESQFLEGGALGHEGLLPTSPEHRVRRVADVRTGHAARAIATAQRFRGVLEAWYGKEAAGKIQHAEAFEICEYGRQPSREELGRLFPFVPRSP